MIAAIALLTACAAAGDGVHGTPPDAPVAVPEFTAVAQDGSERHRADLLGHPSVLWFYPAAATAG